MNIYYDFLTKLLNGWKKILISQVCLEISSSCYMYISVQVCHNNVTNRLAHW